MKKVKSGKRQSSGLKPVKSKKHHKSQGKKVASGNMVIRSAEEYFAWRDQFYDGGMHPPCDE